MFNVSLIVIRKQDPTELRKIQKERVQSIPQQSVQQERQQERKKETEPAKQPEKQF